MAVTRSPVYSITLSYQDRDTNKGSLTFYTSTANTVLEVITALENTIIPTVGALTDAELVGWTLSSVASEDAAVDPPETSDVERKGVFSFGCSNGASYVLQLPSVRNEFVIDGTNTLNMTAAEVQAFIDMVTSDGVLALIRPRNYLGVDIVRLNRAAYKIHRGSKRG